MSDNDEDLFADSDDTDDLIAESKTVAKPKKVKKLGKAAAKKKDIPDADNDDDDDDKALFDSDSEEDDDAPKKMKKKPAAAAPMSKRERMEALQKKKREAMGGGDSGGDEKKRKRDKKSAGGESRQQHADDDISVDSAEIQLTAEDKDFIDTEGDDAEAINELYAEQHFEAEEADEDDMEERPKKRSGGGTKRRKNDAPHAADSIDDKTNPFMQTVERMKKKRKAKGDGPSATELNEEAEAFIKEMDAACQEDEVAISERRPALKKLQMLNTVLDTIARQDLIKNLVENDLLTMLRRWIQPLPNGTLGNVTIRTKLLDAITKIRDIEPSDLKKSELGKVIMTLYKHKKEIHSLKQVERKLIEDWSRGIFKKSGNLQSLESFHRMRGSQEGALSAYSRNLKMEDPGGAAADAGGGRAKGGGGGGDIQDMIASGSTGGKKSGIKRVRVPQSKGFQFTVRPEARVQDHQSAKKQQRRQQDEESRGNLARRMMEKSRKVSKNQRSLGVSIEGRKTK